MIQLLSLFSGIGAFEKALDRLKIDYELVNYCEIDKYASKSYSAIHSVPESLNLGDITQVDTSELPHIDMISYGFPCQDISLAGKQQGLFNEDGTQTRSGLFFEALRIIEDTKPKVAIAENVKNLTSKKFKEQFTIVLDSLEQAGNSIVVDVLEYLFKEIMEVLNVKKVEEVKTITYECSDLIDVAALKEKEPELYEELLADYPAESATYVFKNKTA